MKLANSGLLVSVREPFLKTLTSAEDLSGFLTADLWLRH